MDHIRTDITEQSLLCGIYGNKELVIDDGTALREKIGLNNFINSYKCSLNGLTI